MVVNIGLRNHLFAATIAVFWVPHTLLQHAVKLLAFSARNQTDERFHTMARPAGDANV
jgi:hypothetical protein